MLKLADGLQTRQQHPAQITMMRNNIKTNSNIFQTICRSLFHRSVLLNLADGLNNHQPHPVQITMMRNNMKANSKIEPKQDAVLYFIALLSLILLMGLHTRRSHPVRQHTMLWPQSVSFVHSSGNGGSGQTWPDMKPVGHTAEIQTNFWNLFYLFMFTYRINRTAHNEMVTAFFTFKYKYIMWLE